MLISADAPPATSDYDNWKCYRATTKTGAYSVINGANGQAVTDLTFFDPDGTSTHWYKISYYDVSETDESALSEPMQGLAQVYSTVKKIENFLHLTTVTDSTTPSAQQIAELINRKEDEIDYRTGHAWRLRYSGTASGNDQTANYEYYDIPFPYEYYAGRPVYLKHRKIRTFDTDVGDIMEIWDGTSWVDWTTDKSEGRENDYWLDYSRGIIYIKARYGVSGPLRMRIKYRYGEDIVNKMIEDICTKMVAIDILISDGRAVVLPEGSASMRHGEKVDKMERDIEKKLMGLKEFRTMSITS